MHSNYMLLVLMESTAAMETACLVVLLLFLLLQSKSLHLRLMIHPSQPPSPQLHQPQFQLMAQLRQWLQLHQRNQTPLLHLKLLSLHVTLHQSVLSHLYVIMRNAISYILVMKRGVTIATGQETGPSSLLRVAT
jgi:hypothetical protein